MLTIDEIALKLNLDTDAAYNLMRFLIATGQAIAVNAPSGGKRGKPHKMYALRNNSATEVVFSYMDALPVLDESTSARMEMVQKAESDLANAKAILADTKAKLAA